MRYRLILESEQKKKGYPCVSTVGNAVSKDEGFTDKEIKDDTRWMISKLVIKELRKGGRLILSLEKLK